MNQQVQDQLLVAATYVRKIIKEHISEYKKLNKLPTELSDFPAGACDLTNTILGLYLIKQGFQDTRLENASALRDGNGYKKGQGHAWTLVNGSVAIDITASQFERYKDTDVVVSEQGNDFFEDFAVYRSMQVATSLLSDYGMHSILDSILDELGIVKKL